MIDKIVITRKEKTIPKDFELKLNKMTVITGENNSGKTNFVKSILGSNCKFLDESGSDLEIDESGFIYIPAENIRPADDVFKYSAVSTHLISNLAKLFSNLGLGFKLSDEENIVAVFNDIKNKVNKNLQEFSGSKKHKIDIKTKPEDIDPKVLIKELINSIVVDEYLTEELKREGIGLGDLGQGTQRLIVASIIKAYLDILIEKEIRTDKPILILFEEPEIYLHPKLKRSLNYTLERLSSEPNHQVIITTHDSYFVFPNFDGENKRIVSFVKGGDGMTLPPAGEGIIEGIEDELLFIFLYSRLSDQERSSITIDGVSARTYIQDNNGTPTPRSDYNDLEYIRHQIHHSSDNPNTHKLGVAREDEVATLTAENKNFYTQKELSEAIREMSKTLGASK